MPSDKYVSQAREATGSDEAANMAANAPPINKKGVGVGRADFAPSQQLQGLRGETKTPPDVRKGGLPCPQLYLILILQMQVL